MGWSIDAEDDIDRQLQTVQSDAERFVVKVDQGIKGRFKKGLVLLNVAPQGLGDAVRRLADKGYRWCLVEPMAAHAQAEERYLAISHTRDGLFLTANRNGGIDVEGNAHTMTSTRLGETTDWASIVAQTGFNEHSLRQLMQVYNDNHCTLLEINPYYMHWKGPRLLDLAMEVDDTAEQLVAGWSEDDFRSTTVKALTAEERAVMQLAAKSPASFTLEVMNPDGAVFLLLSGGGASIVVADEVYNRGYGAVLANYGEYSGNPNQQETYLYARAVLSLLLRSTAPQKVLFIGGAVANFTDISSTFGGIIQALNEVAGELRRQAVKVYVRRGGPRQEAGLAMIGKVLDEHGLLGAVHDPSTPLTTAVDEALQKVTL